MNVKKISPRGYCHGVVKALSIVTKTIKNPDIERPIYILGQIVHNSHITQTFADAGVITLETPGKNRLELLDEISSGTVILTAHGVSPAVREKAEAKGLTVVDAVCSDVEKTHDLIRKHTKEGAKIIYIGKKGHPEPEGAVGVSPDNVTLVEDFSDVDALALPLDTANILITNQTTLSIWDVAKVAEYVKKKYPQAEYIKEICDATQTRQEAVIENVPYIDAMIVLGDPKSNNTGRLAQMAKEHNIPTYRIEDIRELDPFWLKDTQTVGVTSGASTPNVITNNAIDFLEQFQYNDSSTWTHKTFFTPDGIVPQLKRK